MSTRFPNLGRPGQIGSLQLKNRMTVAAMGANLAEEDGSCGERIIAYHERQALGGAALIVMGATGVAWPGGAVQPRQVAISEDRHIPGLRAMAKACHRHGAKVAAQLHHGGIIAAQGFWNETPQVLLPSMPAKRRNDMADFLLTEEQLALYNPDAQPPQLHVMEKSDIEMLVERFAQAAGRAVEAGLDALEIHAGHGYIISEFLSPAMNRREDEYGGTLQNRARLLLEILAAVRGRVGRDFPVWVKLDSQEFGRKDGITLEDATATASMLAAAGVDALAVSSYHDSNRGATHSQSNIPHEPEHMVPNATAIGRAVSVPVISAGRIEAAAANDHIGQGHFDFFSMGRKILADPDLPKKLLNDRPADVRPCIYCYCCASQIYIRNAMKCAVNPETTRERELTLVVTDRKKHIAVIGGGPAGMEVSLRLLQRGHRVTLFEAGNRLGGTLQFASIPYEPNQRLLKWLIAQVGQSEVDVRLGVTVTASLLKSFDVDEVVVATGATRGMPEIEGSNRNFVFSGDELRALVMGEHCPGLDQKISDFNRLLIGFAAKIGLTRRPGLMRLASRVWLPLGKRIVIIGGELVGVELAEFLADRGREVVVLEQSDRAGKGLFLVRRMRLLTELTEHGVTVATGTTGVRIAEGQVSYSNALGQERTVAADHVIVAKGASANCQLKEELQAAGLRVHAIGDCEGVAYIEGAMEAAAKLAVTL